MEIDREILNDYMYDGYFYYKINWDFNDQAKIMKLNDVFVILIRNNNGNTHVKYSDYLTYARSRKIDLILDVC